MSPLRYKCAAITSPPPMPEIKEALIYKNNLQKACAELDDCWSKTQLQDTVRSIKYYAELMEQQIK